MKISGLILSAGLSSRMNSFKPMLILNDKPLLIIITEKLLNVCDDVVVVTGHNNNIIESAISEYCHNNSDRIKIVFNQNYNEGMFTSLKKGFSETAGSDWVVYHFVDQPALPEIFYKEFVKQINDNYNWIQPAFKSAKGHPILLHQSFFPLIDNEDKESSLRKISHNPNVKKLIWECSYPQILQDINTKEDFESLKKYKGKVE